MRPLRRFLSIALLAVFGLPFISPLFALSAKSEEGLPSCCRRNGKHHCMMNMTERNQTENNAPEFRAPVEKCPYYPASLMVSHETPFGITLSDAIFAELASHPTGHAQTESKRRISQVRSRQKRGPPSLLT